MTINNKIKIANNILNIIGIKLNITKPEDIDSKFYSIIYQSLFDHKLDGIIEFPISEKDNYNNIVRIIDALSKNILHISLSHIKPEQVLQGQDLAVINMLEIFQGLAECLVKKETKVDEKCKKQTEKYFGTTNYDLKRVKPIVPPSIRNKYENNTLLENDRQKVDKQYISLKKRIDNTDKQADNLAVMTDHAVNTFSSRQQYLHGKIEQLLNKSSNVNKEGPLNPLQEYVYNHKDNLAMVQDRMDRYSITGKQNPWGDVSEQAKMKHGGGIEDDLTCVTMNDMTGEYLADSIDSNESSQASNETYVLESSDKADVREEELLVDVKRKDAWAQVNKQLIQQGYEKEFLDMLLEDEQAVDTHRQETNSKGKLLREFSQYDIAARPFSAFDELLQADEVVENTNNAKTNSSRQCQSDRLKYKLNSRKTSVNASRNLSSRSNLGGFVRPVIKPLGGNHRSHRIEQINNEDLVGSFDNRMRYGSGSGDNVSNIDREMLTRLLDSFPGLQLSEHTLRALWGQAAQQAATIQKAQKHFLSKLGPGERQVEEARRRQELLIVMLRKEAIHQMRLQERNEERMSQIATHSVREKQRQQSARAKRYVEEFSNGMKARMMQKQAKEEQVFRTMFKAALKIQRDRINDMRRYARDVKNEHLYFHQRDLDSLENYYRDRFSMLAESLREERKQIKLQDKSQELALAKLKQEMRSKMETDVRTMQDSMVRSQHEIYFKELDAYNVLSKLSHD